MHDLRSLGLTDYDLCWLLRYWIASIQGYTATSAARAATEETGYTPDRKSLARAASFYTSRGLKSGTP